MANELRTKVEQVKQQEAVQQALKQTASVAGRYRSVSGASEGSRPGKDRLIKKLLAGLKAAPDRVLFPKGNAR